MRADHGLGQRHLGKRPGRLRLGAGGRERRIQKYHGREHRGQTACHNPGL